MERKPTTTQQSPSRMQGEEQGAKAHDLGAEAQEEKNKAHRLGAKAQENGAKAYHLGAKAQKMQEFKPGNGEVEAWKLTSSP